MGLQKDRIVDMKVTLNNIGKKYESREDFTLRHINLEIEDKDFCVILGPSGCGKTTLLRMIAGLNSITEGDLIFGEKRVNKLTSKDRDIAMVFQSYALYLHMTVYDNMAFSLSMRKERILFEKPQNIFVAKFIGSSTINMIKDKMDGSKFISEDGLISLTPSDKDLKALANYNGKDIYLGIRSERFVSGGEKDKF